MQQKKEPAEHGSDLHARRAGLILAAGSAVMVGFMAVHPSIHTHDAAGFFEEMARKAVVAGIVHGALIGAMVVLLVGFVGLVAHLGPRRPLVQAGLVAYCLGVAAHTAAATINGFIVPALTARFASARTHAGAEGSAESIMATLRPLLALCREANSACARLGVVAMSAAIAAWSLALLKRTNAGTRAVGGLGLVCGVVLPVAISAGRLPMDLHGFGVRVLVQAAWTVAVAVQLIRGRL